MSGFGRDRVQKSRRGSRAFTGDEFDNFPADMPAGGVTGRRLVDNRPQFEAGTQKEYMDWMNDRINGGPSRQELELMHSSDDELTERGAERARALRKEFKYGEPGGIQPGDYYPQPLIEPTILMDADPPLRRSEPVEESPEMEEEELDVEMSDP
jgi:hypothetical protein